MKYIGIVLSVLGTMFLGVGLLFNFFHWADLWNGLITGPILIVIGLLFSFVKRKKTE